MTEFVLVKGMVIKCQFGEARVVDVNDETVKLGFPAGRFRTVRLSDVRVDQVLQIPETRQPRSVNLELYRSIAGAFEGGLSFNSQLFAWLIAAAGTISTDDVPVTVMGSDPIEHDRVCQLLVSVGVTVTEPTEDTGILVIGRGNWSGPKLKALLTLRMGETLRVYSQEMALTWIISGCDPFSTNDPAHLRAMAGDHLALTYLEEVEGFIWPTTKVRPSHQSLDGFAAEEIGYLRRQGYRVGKNGIPEYKRRQILEYCYQRGVLPADYSAEYVQSWGAPGSSARLHKIAESIASFCRNYRRKAGASPEAIHDWEADLEWLRKTFYEGRFFFSWPGTDIW